MNALLQQFLLESHEALQGIGEMLMRLEAAPDDAELMTALFRVVHTLKGNSGLFDFPEMTRVLHAGEDLMDAVRDGRVRFSQGLADCLLEAMDFVGQLCDEVEAGREPAARHADASVALARGLRALIGTDPEQAAPVLATGGAARAQSAAGSGTATADLVELRTVLARVSQEVRRDAGESALHLVTYTPSEQCFFNGDDPLLRAMQTPGLVWGAVRAPESWPGLAQLDAYRCVLQFHALSSAPLAQIEDHYRYVAQERRIQAVDPASWGTDTTPPRRAADVDPVLLAMLRTQGEILLLPDDAPWFPGRLRAVVGVLEQCVRRSGRTVQLLPGLQEAAAAALAQRSALPLRAWLAGAFALEPEPAAVAPAPAAPQSAVAHEDATRVANSDPAIDAGPNRSVDSALAAVDAAADVEAEPRFGRRRDDAPGARSLKVDQAKVDRLMNLIGELVVAKNAMPYLANRAETVYATRDLAREIKAQYALVHRICDEMQDAIMQVRMMPVSFVFQRFPRLVRDTSRKLGKQVELVLEGEDTAADKNIIESIGDPLVHIVRNSLDHGIETPEARRAAGKPARGTLRIRAAQESDRVVIEIADDGKGIDPDVVKRKAVEKGLLDDAAAARLGPREAVNLVFAPGFSTAEVVSDLSGRGVGMDVVRTAVERVNGTVSLDSRKGVGTTIRLTLPLSMAVTNVMTFESDGQVFGVPIDAVVETVRIPRSQVRKVKQDMVAVLRGLVLPLKSLNAALGLAAAPRTNGEDELAVLVVRVLDQTIGLLVDDFREAIDIILKPLSGVLGRMQAYSGSALMGDGSVLMVLNVKELV